MYIGMKLKIEEVGLYPVCIVPILTVVNACVYKEGERETHFSLNRIEFL